MNTYELNHAGAMQYSDALRKYYDRQCEKKEGFSIGNYNGWISHFCIDLEMFMHKDTSFLKALFSFKPYVIGRILLYDSEGYIHVMEKIEKKMKEV